MVLPELPIGETVETGIYWLNDNFGFLMDIFSEFIDMLISGFKDMLLFLPPIVFIILVTVLVFLVSKKNTKLAVGTAIGFAYR
ncbi:MAG: hypothetical protein R2741_03215 [Methanolobus sp.]